MISCVIDIIEIKLEWLFIKFQYKYIHYIKAIFNYKLRRI